MDIKYENTQEYFMKLYEKALLEAQKGNSIASILSGEHTYYNLNLRGMNFVNFAFENIEFVNCNFYGCNFESSNFTNCKFTGDTVINKCRFLRVCFQETIVRNAFIKGCTFVSAFFTSDTNFGYSYFIDNILDRITVSEDVFKCASFYKNTFTKRTNMSSSLAIDGLELICPEEGAFIGFKKAVINGGDKVLVKLLIPEDAKRLSSNERKCRCDKAEVLAITSLDGEKSYDVAASIHDSHFKYNVGETVIVEDFDDDRRVQCSNGIHFFITKQEAINYCY